MAEEITAEAALGAPTELQPCEEGSDEHLMFCSVMEELESLCGGSFECFMVLGLTKQVVNGTIYQAKIKVAESGDTPVLHVKVYKSLGSDASPEVQMFKANQSTDAPFSFTEENTVFRTMGMGIEQPMEVDESSQAAATTEPAQPQGQSISSMVNQQEVTMLMDMGFSRNVAEKAIFMVQGAGVERAMEWIENNREQPDFEEALMIVGQDQSAGPSKPSQFAGMTKEEKAAKIKEIQAQARARRQAEEKKNAIENEKARARMDKELAAAKRIADEQEFERSIALQKAEKAELAREKARMREQLERDRRERFGGKPPSEETKAQKTPAQLVEHGIKTVKTLYTEIRAPGVAKTCLKTVSTFIKNAQKDPTNEKFRKVNLDNNAVQTRVAKINGGVAILKAVGFKMADDGSNYLVIDNINDAVLVNAIEQLAPHID